MKLSNDKKARKVKAVILSSISEHHLEVASIMLENFKKMKIMEFGEVGALLCFDSVELDSILETKYAEFYRNNLNGSK